MSLAWFITDYTTDLTGRFPVRACHINQYSALIGADGGAESETEVLGGYALVKVRASDATLATIAADPNFQRLPGHWSLSDALGDLTNAQRNAIVAKLQAMGYTLAEIRAVLPSGNWAAITLGQVLRFAAQRRLEIYYDGAAGQWVSPGAYLVPRPVDDVDAAVA